MSKARSKVCGNCKHFEPGNQCRRRAPKVFMCDAPENWYYETMFPLVTENDWCGEYFISDQAIADVSLLAESEGSDE